MRQTVALEHLVAALKDPCEVVLEDSSVVFESDGTFVYLSDIDSGIDLLQPYSDGEELWKILIDHHGEEYGNLIFQELESSQLIFSDQFNHNDFQLGVGNGA